MVKWEVGDVALLTTRTGTDIECVVERIEDYGVGPRIWGRWRECHSHARWRSHSQWARFSHPQLRSHPDPKRVKAEFVKHLLQEAANAPESR